MSWVAVYAALAAGGVGVGHGLAMRHNHQSEQPRFDLAASSNQNNGNSGGNGNGHPPFSIASTPVDGLVPGGAAKSLSITLTNSDNVAYRLLTFWVDVNDASCPATQNLAIAGFGRESLLGSVNKYDSSVAGVPQFEIPKKSTLTVTGTIRLLDLPTVNQNGCKSRTFTLKYSGTATQGSGVGN